ncbi:uncharacterized protein VTP21DRAFT_5477 [Calcarisporiella thermophila]|uniref:uncharacterized protein n=1 Tax=Calcarisporiella thermophila TaxID=911321 RepID=UPI0037445215
MSSQNSYRRISLTAIIREMLSFTSRPNSQAIPLTSPEQTPTLASFPSISSDDSYCSFPPFEELQPKATRNEMEMELESYDRISINAA